MYQTITTTNDGQAFIAIKRNRVKHSKINPSLIPSSVYLKDKTEFEIELYNPTQNTKLAKISINGKLISTSGVVLKPGQRIYLERYLDDSKKFLFETYEVENNNHMVAQAIANNGLIQVEFYDEQIRHYDPLPLYNLNDYNYYKSKPTMDFFTTTSCTTFNSSFTSSEKPRSILRSASLETGRVEKGNHSNQSFTRYNGEFNTYTSNTVQIKIVPISQKPIEAEDLAVYCTECGTKNRGGKYKFCPKCGNKFGE